MKTILSFCVSQMVLTFMLPWIVIDFFLNNQPDTLIIQILFRYKTLHVLGNLFAHHQEFSTVHLALVSFMQVFDDCFQAESGWNLLKWTCGNIQLKTVTFTAILLYRNDTESYFAKQNDLNKISMEYQSLYEND